MSTLDDTEAGRTPPVKRRLFRRGPWENLASLVIALGIVMLMQPVSLLLYSYSFITILAGTAMFVVVSKFPE
jgi:hypothetical protein